MKMITRELVQRINELSRKQRTEGLTPGEKEEQQKLRNLYLQGIKAKVADALESYNIKPVKTHKDSCRCGHCATVKRRGKN